MNFYFMLMKIKAVGIWLLAFSCWLLAFGCWLLAFGFCFSSLPLP